MRQITLDVHLTLFARGWRLQRDDAKDARTHALRNGLDCPTLPGPVASFENDADLEALVHDPLLDLHQLDMQPLQFLFVLLALELARLTRDDLVASLLFALRHRLALHLHPPSLCSLANALLVMAL